MNKNFQVFISYRRDGGETLGRMLYDRLNPAKGKKGYYRLPVWKWAALVLVFAAITAAAAVILLFTVYRNDDFTFLKKER